MRAIVPLFLIGCSVTLLCASCAAPRATSPHFSPPSAAPVRDKVRAAQAHAAIAKSRVAAAAAALKKNLSAGTPKGTFETNALPIDDLTVATQEIDALTAELLTAQIALTNYEQLAAIQTDSLNRANDDKNAALLDRDREKRLANKIAGQRNKLFLLLSAALIWIFRTPLFALARAGLAIITKLPI